MLFRKHIEPHCAYCKKAEPVEPGYVVCRKRGIVSEADHCRAFRYDPLRRVPPRPAAPDFSKYDGRDYSL